MKGKIRIIIADAQLDPVPKDLWRHPSVISDSRRRKRHPSKILLYTPIHYTAMREAGLSMDKYGRPDITHRILLAVLDHPLTRMNYTEIYVYRREGDLIWVNPSTKIPLDYYRFEGLIIQLLERKMIPPNDGKFMKILDTTELSDIIDNPVILKVRGKMITSIPPQNLINRTVIVGAFQRGEYSNEIRKIKAEKISVYNDTLLASTAISIFLTYIYCRSLF